MQATCLRPSLDPLHLVLSHSTEPGSDSTHFAGAQTWPWERQKLLAMQESGMPCAAHHHQPQLACEPGTLHGQPGNDASLPCSPVRKP